MITDKSIGRTDSPKHSEVSMDSVTLDKRKEINKVRPEHTNQSESATNLYLL
jgi:hypothetical protein